MLSHIAVTDGKLPHQHRRILGTAFLVGDVTVEPVTPAVREQVCTDTRIGYGESSDDAMLVLLHEAVGLSQKLVGIIRISLVKNSVISLSLHKKPPHSRSTSSFSSQNSQYSSIPSYPSLSILYSLERFRIARIFSTCFVKSMEPRLSLAFLSASSTKRSAALPRSTGIGLISNAIIYCIRIVSAKVSNFSQTMTPMPHFLVIFSGSVPVPHPPASCGSASPQPCRRNRCGFRSSAA